MLEKINDLSTVDSFFVIALKNDKKEKMEINKLHKISISVVKQTKSLYQCCCWVCLF